MSSLVLRPSDPSGRPPAAHLILRGAAFVIDVAVVCIVNALAGIRCGTEVQPLRWQLNGLPACGMMVFTPGYFLLSESIFRATFGKFVFGLQVLSLKPGELGFSQVLKRNLVKAFDFPTFGFVSLAVALSNPLRQSLGDLWASTMIVNSGTYAKWRAGAGGLDFDKWLKSFHDKPAANQ